MEYFDNLYTQKEIPSLENSINPYMFSLAIGLMDQLYSQQTKENVETICEILQKNYLELKDNFPRTNKSDLTNIVFGSLFEGIYADFKNEL